MSITDSWRPTAIIIGPGGLKGFIYLGALRALEQNNWLSNVTSYTGVSVGSMISLMLICGYTIDEIIKIANSRNFTGDLINSIARLFNLDILAPDKSIINILNDKVTEKFGKVLTLKELYDLTGVEFTAVSLNVDIGNVIYFNYKNHPNLSATLAVAASIGVPGVLPRVEYEDDIHVDGALGDPYPVMSYKNTNHKVLGIYIDNLIPPRVERTNKGFGAELIMTIRIYEGILSCMQRSKYIESKLNSPDNIKHLIIRCTNDIKLNSNLTTDDKALMLVEGWESANILINSNV